VAASAPGFEAFKATVTVAEGKAESVAIRELVPAKAPEIKPEIKQPEIKQPEIKQPEIKQPEAKQPMPPVRTSQTRKIVGIGVASAGAVMAGVGFFLGASASSTFKDAKALCGDALICENDADFAKGQDLIDRARSRATLSTAFVIAGGVAVAAGVVIVLTAPKRRTETAVVPVVSDRDLGVALLGRF
jgi:hypothetical protein